MGIPVPFKVDGGIDIGIYLLAGEGTPGGNDATDLAVVGSRYTDTLTSFSYIKKTEGAGQSTWVLSATQNNLDAMLGGHLTSTNRVSDDQDINQNLSALDAAVATLMYEVVAELIPNIWNPFVSLNTLISFQGKFPININTASGSVWDGQISVMHNRVGVGDATNTSFDVYSILRLGADIAGLDFRVTLIGTGNEQLANLEIYVTEAAVAKMSSRPASPGHSHVGTYQPLDGNLSSISTLGTQSGKFLYSIGPKTWAEADTTAAGRTMMASASANTQLALLGGAPLASPAFTGAPTTTAPLSSDNTTRVATTKFANDSATTAANLVTVASIGAAPAVHNQDASTITSGVFDIARMPAGVLERLIIVATQAARYALTTDTVQLGDTVKQNDTGILYYIVDTNNLGNNAGYEVYAAGTAADVPNATVISKLLTGFSALAGVVAVTDTILQAFNKIVGNIALRATIASPTFTGIPAADTAAVGTNTTQLATTAFVQAEQSYIQQNIQSSSYTFVLADAGKGILHPVSDNNARTFTIPANSSVPYRIGTTIIVVNRINTVTIGITSDTLVFSNDNTTGTRTLAAGGVATMYKAESNVWMISGTSMT